MAKIRYLHMPPGRTDLYFRRKVPEDLRGLFDCGEFYKVPLGTKDPRAAEPMLAIANGEFEKKVAAFRETLKNQGAGSLSAADAKALVERFLTGRSNGGFATGGTQAAFMLMELDRAVDDLVSRSIPTAQSMSAADWTAYRQRIAGSDVDDEFGEEALARIEKEQQVRHRPAGQAWFDYQSRVPRRRWRPLLTDTVAALKRKLALAEGDIPGIDEPLADALASALASPDVRQQLPQTASARRRPQAGRAQPDMKLETLLRKWRIGRSPTPKAIAATEKAVEYFVSYLGNVSIGEITAEDCFEFRDALTYMPASMPRAERQLAFSELVSRYQCREYVQRVKPGSIKKYLGAIQALLGFAFQERFLPSNVSAGIKVDGYTKSSGRRPFTKDELRKLFAAPLFTTSWSAGKQRSTVSDATLRWLFFLGLCTGGRIEELGQILLPDIKKTEGVWYIDVTSYIPDEVAESAPDFSKRTKTDFSVRVVPIHPKLLELGFVEHVEALRKAGAIKLFADLRPDSLLVQTKEASRLAARIIDKAVSDDPRIVFHSFRHTFKDLCREADVPKDAHDQIMGHAPADAGGSYGLGRAVVHLHRHLTRIDLSFIDWAPTHTARKL